MAHIEDDTLQAFVDGQCREPERSRIERHLVECEECSERFAEANDAAGRASELLGELEPGPVHAPPWRELEERVASRAPEVEPSAIRAPWWRQPALAWAASLILAFGLGWLARSGSVGTVGLSGTLREQATAAGVDGSGRSSDARPGQSRNELDAVGPEGESEVSRQRAVEGTPARSERLTTEPEVPQAEPESVAEQPEAPVAELAPAVAGAAPQTASSGEVTEEVANVAEKLRAEQAAADAAAAPPVAQATGSEVGAAAADARAGGRGAPEPSQQAMELARSVAEPAVAAEGFELRDRFELDPGLAPLFAYRDADGTLAGAGFVPVQPEQAESLLGATLRRIPDLDLVRIDVGPARWWPQGVTGFPVVRQIYRSANDQQIVLVQQVVASRENLNAPDARRLDDSGEIPALVVEPSGVRGFVWSTADGYVLGVYGAVDERALRTLADQVR